MLKKRVIPTLLLSDNRLKKGINFKNYRDVGDPISSVKIYNNQFADELIFINIDRDSSHEYLCDLLKKVSENCFIPLCAGGSIDSTSKIRDLLNSGADKVMITTAALNDFNLIEKSVNMFGGQAIVIGIDIITEDKQFYLSTFSKKLVHKDIDIFAYIKKFEDIGVGEILINFVDLDGLMKGPNIEFSKKIAEFTNLPVIYLGGIGNVFHILDLFEKTKINAVACASIFHYGDNNTIRIRSTLKNKGIKQRKVK
tara:strand:+ start:1458 stop:2219 length:762 start_codon:yes stop_codon:yes gene_type:complete